MSFTPSGVCILWSNRLQTVCLFVSVSLIVQCALFSLSLSAALSLSLSALLSLSPVSFQCRGSTCYPMSWLVQRAEANALSGLRAAGLHGADSSSGRGLNVLGVAVVTTPPHKLHQPAILL